MTSARQERKPRRAHRALRAGLAALIYAGYAGSPPPRAATNQAVVVDWHTGLAIGGYDPVAFYTDGKPVPGSADCELLHAGVVWRFSNVGNREAFAAHPDVYMPQFGGYDPLGVARGVAVAGNPNVWLIDGGRLFLFYDRSRLEDFAADAQRLTGTAERKWSAVLRSLDP
jgi:hypothetical protein